MLDQVIFYFFAAIAVISAILTVTRRNVVHSAIFLITALLATAGIFLQLRAEFLFIVQIILYVGGIMVLFVFVIMLVNLDVAVRQLRFARQKWVALVISLALALFIIGVIGVVTRRNVIVILMSIELILNAVNINLVAFSRLYGDVAGQVFALFIIADAAAEAAVGLGIIIAFFRNRETVLEDEMDLLKW